MRSKKPKEPPPTIDNNGEPVVTTIPRLQRDTLGGIANGYADVFDGLMDKSIDAKSASHMNKALSGKLNAHRAEFDMLQRLEVGKDRLRKHFSQMLGVVYEPPGIENAKSKEEKPQT